MKTTNLKLKTKTTNLKLKMKTINKSILIATIIISFFSACKKDDDLVNVPQPIQNEPEVISSAKLIITDSITGTAIDTVTFLDPDGDGGNGPTVFDTIRLQANTTYFMDVVLLNTLTNPADTISNEVAEEANDHQFFFTFSGVTITHTYLDNDTNTPPLPIGLQNKIRTGAPGTGTTQVLLKHQPGIKDGNIATGDTDVDITFQTIIQ